MEVRSNRRTCNSFAFINWGMGPDDVKTSKVACLKGFYKVKMTSEDTFYLASIRTVTEMVNR